MTQLPGGLETPWGRGRGPGRSRGVCALSCSGPSAGLVGASVSPHTAVLCWGRHRPLAPSRCGLWGHAGLSQIWPWSWGLCLGAGKDVRCPRGSVLSGVTWEWPRLCQRQSKASVEFGFSRCHPAPVGVALLEEGLLWLSDRQGCLHRARRGLGSLGSCRVQGLILSGWSRAQESAQVTMWQK